MTTATQLTPSLDVQHATGPAAPQPGLNAPVHGLAVWDVPTDDRLWVAGVHGGAGETTLAVALAGTGTDRRWPRADHADSAPPRVLLVARTHLAGLRAAQRAAQQWAAGATPDVELLGLALVPDAPGRLPKQLRDFAQVVAGGFPHSWSLPWEEGLRLAEPKLPGELPLVDAADVPRSLRQLAHDLSHIRPRRSAPPLTGPDHSNQKGRP
ncbi:DUF6668 family protein [Modestobacter sp. SYSU DS0511]